MKIAIVFDDLIQQGGAEKLFLAALEIWPDAEVYTSVASPKWLEILSEKNIKMKLSFMQKLPFRVKLNRFYGALLLHVLAFQSFKFDSYDVVLCISSRFSHLVTTPPNTLHISYINSPARMFWNPSNYFREESISAWLLAPFMLMFRLYDYAVTRGSDYIIANSKTPQKRIKKYYGLEASIIYPFADTTVLENYQSDIAPLQKDNHFVVITRLVPWKKVDYVIEAFNKLNLPLKIIGEGPDKLRLEKLANSNIEFLGYVSEEEKVRVLESAKALIVSQHEDFGITPIESMFCGTPVIAFGKGGVLETVVQHETGVLFFEQDSEALVSCLENFSSMEFSEEKCRQQALKYTKLKFMNELKSFVEKKCAEINN